MIDEMQQRGEEMDLLDILVVQGALTSEQARGIRDATAAEGVKVPAGKSATSSG